MTEVISGAIWKKRMQDLSRNVGRPHTPLFAPLLFSVAAQIEAITPLQMASDGTRLRKNIGELRRMLGLDAVMCAIPAGMEIEALGIEMDAGVWPPKPAGKLPSSFTQDIDIELLLSSQRIKASLEAVKQWQVDASEPVIVAALTGPATLLVQLREAGLDADEGAAYECVGRILAALARAYAEAGIHVLQLHESVQVNEPSIEAWKGALGTAGNVARFHRIPPILIMEEVAPPSWPAQAVPCPTPTQSAAPPLRLQGRAWSGDIRQWPAMPGEEAIERYISSVGEVAKGMEIPTLMNEIAEFRKMQLSGKSI